jgi:regulator of protease activity HflC (stomatin/prohibitin superfamily)
LDEATETWGVKVIRVEVQEIKISDALRDALEEERAAESRRKATISETEGVVESIQRLSRALQSQPHSQEVLKFLVAQRYVESNLKLGESNNSKIIFMDPGQLTEAVNDLLHPDDPPPPGSGGATGNGSNAP